VSQLRPYKPPTIPGQQITPQAPVEVEGEEEYIVEEILDSCLRCNKLEFLVKWEGYMNENNLWEPEDIFGRRWQWHCTHFYNYPQVPTNCSHSYILPTLLKTPACYILDMSLISLPQYILPPPQLPLVLGVLFVALG